MIAVDTNILVYAHRSESDWNARAYQRLEELMKDDTRRWGIPWPCLHEFLSAVTHPRIFRPPTPLELAMEQVEEWLASPNLQVLGETPGYWPRLRRTLESSQVVGPRIHDARIATICLENGVRELWSADRDFSRFPRLKVVNPVIS